MTLSLITQIAILSATLLNSVIGLVGSILSSVSGVGVILAITVFGTIISGLLGAQLALMLVQTALLTGILAGVWATAFASALPFKKGGLVPKGYAEGGGIPRPANIPASDTVPAWLTPGEYVLPVALVKRIGVGFLERLRSGVASPDSFRQASSFMSGAGVRGYATGGAVQNTNSRGGGSKQPQQIILPVLPASNETIDQLLTGGRTSFAKNMNSVRYTGDPNRSKGW
jgi:hypothetical protein